MFANLLILPIGSGAEKDEDSFQYPFTLYGAIPPQVTPQRVMSIFSFIKEQWGEVPSGYSIYFVRSGEEKIFPEIMEASLSEGQNGINAKIEHTGRCYQNKKVIVVDPDVFNSVYEIKGIDGAPAFTARGVGIYMIYHEATHCALFEQRIPRPKHHCLMAERTGFAVQFLLEKEFITAIQIQDVVRAEKEMCKASLDTYRQKKEMASRAQNS
ncbi:MAG: hypothetical protein AAB545_01650 [Patescibacteria group bacterium]